MPRRPNYCRTGSPHHIQAHRSNKSCCVPHALSSTPNESRKAKPAAGGVVCLFTGSCSRFLKFHRASGTQPWRGILRIAAPELMELERATLASEVRHVLADPACADLFGPGSRAEAELIAHVPTKNGKTIEVSARLDRILVSGDTVTVADFKSDAVIPKTIGEVSAHYIEQLAAYRAALSGIFPDRRIRALLVFTAGPRLFEIPEESLESAWARLQTRGSAAIALNVS